MMNEQYNCPIKLDEARAWRTYLGGRLLDEYHGRAGGADGHFPEEWIASLVTARNAGREEMAEGLSMVSDMPGISLKELIESDPQGYLGARHAGQLGPSLGVLIKLIDSSERLTVQVHPDKQMAAELFDSDYGKTECWYILGGRTVDGVEPCIYLGFREGVTREQWTDCFNRQDISGLLDCLHRFPVQPGDVILIEGGVPHAIGAGCFLAEIQEPTDYTIRVERTTPSGFPVADQMCHQGLGFDRMFDCFSYYALPEAEVRARWFLQPVTETVQGDSRRIRLAGYQDTPCFAMDLLEVSGSLSVPKRGCSAVYMLSGHGELHTGGARISVSQGEQYFLPAGVEAVEWISDPGICLKVLQCFGPQI